MKKFMTRAALAVSALLMSASAASAYDIVVAAADGQKFAAKVDDLSRITFDTPAQSIKFTGETANEINTGNDAATFTVPFEASMYWAIRRDDASANWVRLSENYGFAGENSLTITVSANATGKTRTTSFTMLCGFLPTVFTVTQGTDGLGTGSGSEWGEGSDHDISSSVDEINYGELKVGDYYYNDGSWSDGGFTGYVADIKGGIEWATPRPAPVLTNPVTGKARTVVGIVFCTDVDRIGDAEKAEIARKGGTPHGLVMALKQVNSSQWCYKSVDETAIGVANVAGSAGDPLYPYANAAISGYGVCKTILEKRPDDVANQAYKGIYDCQNYGTVLMDRSTGWFVGSTGQWFDLLRNLTGIDFTDKCDFYFIENGYYPDDGVHFDWQLDFNKALIEKYYYTNYLTLLNEALAGVDAADKMEFNKAENYITSTMCNASNSYYFALTGGKFISCKAVDKTYYNSVRPILAF